MWSTHPARRSATVTAVVALVASLMVLWAPARPADASLGFDNARMADIALSYVGHGLSQSSCLVWALEIPTTWPVCLTM